MSDHRQAGFFAGIDVGASTAKAVIIDGGGRDVGHDVRPSGMDFAESGLGALHAALELAGLRLHELSRIVATGYGRDNVPVAHDTRTEIACHGKGAYHHHPHAMTVVDIGGQDNKVIRLSEDGRRLGFRMNRKCAAGTGAFLEEIAARLAVPLDELNDLALRADAADTGPLSSFCTVFASTEVLSRIRAGDDKPTLARSIFTSVVARVTETTLFEGDVMATGGVAAHNPAFLRILEQVVGRPIIVPPHPQLVGALGAALVARDEQARGGQRSQEPDDPTSPPERNDEHA